MKAGDKYQACVDALAAFAKGAGFSQVVIGLSGGIDSSVTAVMAVDAFGAKNVHGVLLPGPYSTGHSIDDALALAENLGIESHTVSICEPFEAFEQVIRKSYKGKARGFGFREHAGPLPHGDSHGPFECESLDAREHWQQVRGGDGFTPRSTAIRRARLPRSRLVQDRCVRGGPLAHEQARTAGDVEPIPENVFVKPPSAELAPGQKDEASMGIDYETLDKLLIAVQEQGTVGRGRVRCAGLRHHAGDRPSRASGDSLRSSALRNPPFPT